MHLIRFFYNRISCLRLLINGEVDFTTVEPEDLMVLGMTEEYNKNVLVTHELRIWEKSNYYTYI